ncbi:MAG: pyridoxamine 5-phosphate oxidase-related FMN-binding [Actinomycetia bacterium]|nr:pyridoxamine 5-phosphate oxidase-related FMN-binding [Actinomycetes bacterium]
MVDEKPKRVSIRLSADEAWAVIEGSHTGILTTLRRDGVPMSLPVWFVVIDRLIYSRTRTTAKKVARAANDTRAGFLVESGERWVELRAVHLTGRVDVLHGDDPVIPSIEAALTEKYSSFRTPRAQMPDATRGHYERDPNAYLRFTPDERIVSWDNDRLGLP